MTKRDKFTFEISYWDDIKDLPAEDCKRFMGYIVEYAGYRNEPTITDSMEKLAWDSLYLRLKKGWEQHDRVCSKGKKNEAEHEPSMNRTRTELKPSMNRTQTEKEGKEKTEKKEKKQNKEKGENKGDNEALPSLSPEEVDFAEKMKSAYPTLSRMKEPLTLAQKNIVLENYSTEQIKEKLNAMENTLGIEKKYKSVYRTLLNWLKKDEDKR